MLPEDAEWVEPIYTPARNFTTIFFGGRNNLYKAKYTNRKLTVQ